MLGYDTFALPDMVPSVFPHLAFGQLRFAGGGVISTTGVGGHLQITVEKAASDRFLAANELFIPGWTATADGKPVEVYPANAGMRGVVVPAGATKVDFLYTPVVSQRNSTLIYASALILFVILVFVFGRRPFTAAKSDSELSANEPLKD
jgi:hypothetical protein